MTPTESRQKKVGLSPARVYWQYIYRAGKEEIPLSLSKARMYELFQGDCHYCGIPPDSTYNRANCIQTFKYNGIDRVDSSKGYEEGNVVSCCKHCNQAKNDMSVGEFMSWLRRVVKFQDLRLEK